MKKLSVDLFKKRLLERLKMEYKWRHQQSPEIETDQHEALRKQSGIGLLNAIAIIEDFK